MEVGLKVLTGLKAGQIVKLPMPLCLIGRGKECHVRSGQAAVSQRHCVLTARGDELVVCDLESLNGTYVNGEKVSGEVALRRGDKLQIGPLKFEIMIKLASRAPRNVSESELLASGTARGNAHLSTMMMKQSKRAAASSDLDAAPLPENDAPTLAEEALFLPGQAVVVAAGLLEGVKATIVKQVAGGYLIALEGQERQVLAMVPVHLLRLD